MVTPSVLKAVPTVTRIDNGIEKKDRELLAAHLGSALANSYMLYVKTQNFHWNVVGPMFYSVHKMTEEQYTDIAEAIDDIAERIRALGYIAPGSISKFVELSLIEDAGEQLTTEAMLEELARDHQTCSRIMRDAVLAAEKVDDVKTADLLTDRIGQHEEFAWMLNAMMAS